MNITPSSCLTFGILSAALSWLGIPGIVLGVLGRKRAAAYVDYNGFTTGQVKTGSILSMVGLIVGIVFTVYWGIVITVACVACVGIAAH